jgi:hypothetical protein
MVDEGGCIVVWCSGFKCTTYQQQVKVSQAMYGSIDRSLSALAALKSVNSPAPGRRRCSRRRSERRWTDTPPAVGVQYEYEYGGLTLHLQ